MLAQLRDKLNGGLLPLSATRGETGGEKWTAQTWYTLALALESLSANRSLPMALRDWLDARAEAAWVTGDWRRGVSPADWEAQCAIYRAEDEERLARRSVADCPAQAQFDLVTA